MKNKRRRPFTFLLLAAMIFTMWGSPVYAAADSGEAGQKPETENGAQEQCSCMILCTEDHKNPDCPVCGAEGADFADCKGKPAAKTENPAVAAVIALIDALPAVDEIYDGMVGDCEEGYDEWLAGMQTILADIQRAKVEYDALSVEERALIDQTHTDKLQELVGLADRLKEAAPMTDNQPTVYVNSTEIFANGIPIKIVAGTTEGRTNILWDRDGDGSIGDDEYLKIGSDTPSASGYDLSSYYIYGGADDDEVADTHITMTGGKETPITTLGGNTISVRLPYAPAKEEIAGNLYAVYVDDAGKVEWITKSSYDASQKAVVFEAGHFSVCGIGYKNPAPAFTDV